ncbi:hypothetical protein [Nocardioides halotolerans]|jgi:hypothetical protein|uniref:hypothetical protein n=1 Tax=Nocardioides halotolerans TaxID=433660 RepID=UPI00041E2395|nr:hypothetical protein [Nocardioides halotolerans]
MGFGDSLKKWATSKATEMLTADSDKRESAAASADAAESQARSDLGETLLRTAFPKLGELADKQEADRVAREEAEEQERREEILSMPLASVQLSVTGHVTDNWSGQLHWSWNDVSPNEPDPTDPYADKPLAWFELFAEDTARPDLGGMLLTHWSFQLPGYHGDGTYDLSAIAQEREAAGAALDYLEWSMDFANADDASFYFYSGSGPSSVTVSEGGKKLAVVMSMSGALGDLTATATITR